MEPLKVYRVEGPDGKGMYLSNSAPGSCSWPSDRGHGSGDGRPTPQDDCGIDRYIYCDELCGFASLQQLRAWLPKEDQAYLAHHGFKVKVYRSTQYVIGECQTLFQ